MNTVCSNNKNVYPEKVGGEHRASPPLQIVGDMPPVHPKIYAYGCSPQMKISGDATEWQNRK